MHQNKEQKHRKILGIQSQALVEVAILGTVILFCMIILIRTGLQANYSQYLRMKAHRDAIAEAYSTRKNLKGFSHIVVEDKHVPSPLNPFGIGSVQPFYANAAITWSQDLYGNPRHNDFPRMNMKINGQAINLPETGFSPRHTHAGDPNPEWGLRAAGYEKTSWGGTKDIWVKINDYPADINDPFSDRCRPADLDAYENHTSREYICGDGEGDGIYWRWTMVQCKNTMGRGYVVPDRIFTDVDCREEFDYPSNSEKTVTRGSMADIDGDWKEESVIKVEGSCNDDGKYRCSQIKYFDYQLGDIDLTVNTWDRRHDIPQQGLQAGYTIGQETAGSNQNLLRRLEDSNKIEVREYLDTDFNISRQVLLNAEGTTCSGNNCYVDIQRQRSLTSSSTTIVELPLE